MALLRRAVGSQVLLHGRRAIARTPGVVARPRFVPAGQASRFFAAKTNSSDPKDWPFWGPPPSLRDENGAEVVRGTAKPPKDKKNFTPTQKVSKHYNSLIVSAFRHNDERLRLKKVRELLSRFAKQSTRLSLVNVATVFHRSGNSGTKLQKFEHAYLNEQLQVATEVASGQVTSNVLYGLRAQTDSNQTKRTLDIIAARLERLSEKQLRSGVAQLTAGQLANAHHGLQNVTDCGPLRRVLRALAKQCDIIDAQASNETRGAAEDRNGEAWTGIACGVALSGLRNAVGSNHTVISTLQAFLRRMEGAPLGTFDFQTFNNALAAVTAVAGNSELCDDRRAMLPLITRTMAQWLQFEGALQSGVEGPIALLPRSDPHTMTDESAAIVLPGQAVEFLWLLRNLTFAAQRDDHEDEVDGDDSNVPSLQVTNASIEQLLELGVASLELALKEERRRGFASLRKGVGELTTDQAYEVRDRATSSRLLCFACVRGHRCRVALLTSSELYHRVSRACGRGKQHLCLQPALSPP